MILRRDGYERLDDLAVMNAVRGGVSEDKEEKGKRSGLRRLFVVRERECGQIESRRV